MKRTFLFSIMLAVFTHQSSFAQYNSQMAGSGIWGGQQGCQMEQGPAPGAQDQSDELNAVKQRIAAQKKKKVELERKLSRYKSEANKAKQAINKRLNADISSQVFEHMERPDLGPKSYSCKSGSAGVEAGAGATLNGNSQGDGTQIPGPGEQSGSGTPGMDPSSTGPQISLQNTPFCNKQTGYNYWADYALAGGQVREKICDVRAWTKAGVDSFDCKAGLQDFAEAKREMEDTREELNTVKTEIKVLEREYSETRNRLAELKDAEETEGGYCATCHSGRRQAYQPSGWQVAAGLLTAAAGGALGYFGGKYAVDQNAKLGWPTSPYYAAGLAYPMIAAGMYGAVGGGMLGGVGCGTTVGGPGMMGGMGGPGAFGMAPGLYGGMGGMPGMMGYPGMMMMGGGMMMGMPMMGGGYPGMMMMGGGMMVGGMPMMGMPMMMMGGGMMVGGYPGMMMMGGGMAMGMPMMGMPGMMPYPMMGGGAMMMPMMGSGMLPYPMMGGGMAMGMPGMMMGGGMMMGMPMGGGMGMPMMGGMGMQNMMMQQYYAQMQQQMAYQQQAMSDYMQRMQTVGYLSNEMSRLQQQIMMISSGMGGSYSVMPGMGGYGAPSVLPYPGYSGGGSMYGAPPTIPYPGSTPYGPGTAAPIR